MCSSRTVYEISLLIVYEQRVRVETALSRQSTDVAVEKVASHLLISCSSVIVVYRV